MLPRRGSGPYLGAIEDRRAAHRDIGNSATERNDKGRFKVNDTLFTTYSLAKYLHVSPRTVQREVSRGRLTFVMVGGRRRYRRDDVEYYLRRQLQRSGFRVIDGGRSQVARFG